MNDRATEQEFEAERRKARELKKAEERRSIAAKMRESEAKAAAVKKGSGPGRGEFEGACEMCGHNGLVTVTDEGDFCGVCLAKIGGMR